MKQKNFKKPLVISDNVIYNKGTKGGKRWLKGNF